MLLENVGGDLLQANRPGRTIHVAVAQASSTYPDAQASLRKALTLIEEASAAGAKLVCLGETFLPGYPAWLDCCEGAALWNHSPVKEVFAELRANSVVVPGVETTALAEVAARLQIGIVIGINERVQDGPGHGTLYNSLLFFGEDGRLVNHHRKLIPTYSERMIWGQGDANGLRCVKLHGINVGGLICWEHWMPLARQHMHNQGEEIHIAVWPTVHEMHQVASRHYAFEGRCFVLAAGQIMRAAALPATLCSASPPPPEAFVERGGSAIIAPDGRYLAGPIFEDEVILSAILELKEIDREAMTLDVSGHYSRPDVFQLSVTVPGRK
jgi:nitrilase